MRPFFIGLSITLGYSINPLVMAENAGPEIQNNIHNFSFKKEDIEALIKLLEFREAIESYQACDALLRLESLSETDIKLMTMDSMNNAKEGEFCPLGALGVSSDDGCISINTSFDIESSEDNIQVKYFKRKVKKYQ